MEKEQFLASLQEELIKQGLPPADAARHTRAISLTLSEEDMAEMEKMDDPQEITVLAAGIMSVKTRGTIRAATASPEIVKDGLEITKKTPLSDCEKVHMQEIFSETHDEEEVNDETVYDAIVSAESPVQTPPATRRGRTIFWSLFFLTLPLAAAFVICYFALFTAIFALICTALVLLVTVPIISLAIGGTLALTGIIFGVLQLLTEVSLAPGLFEIGLGFSIGGFVMLCGILIYNGVVRLIPLFVRLIRATFRFSTRKIKEIFNKAKEACYAL